MTVNEKESYLGEHEAHGKVSHAKVFLDGIQPAIGHVIRGEFLVSRVRGSEC